MGAWIETWLEGSRWWYSRSRTLYGCVDWNFNWVKVKDDIIVAPYMGAWIETLRRTACQWRLTSHPIWVRGLKHRHYCISHVPCSRTLYGCVDWNLMIIIMVWNGTCRTLYGCVDWNQHQHGHSDSEFVAPYMGAWIETCKRIRSSRHKNVAPYMGAWIETLKATECQCRLTRRTLYGCVDWNPLVTLIIMDVFVAPYMDAWIETTCACEDRSHDSSHPIWVRRLKPGHQNYKAMSSTIIPLVPSSFALRYISIMPPLCLRYTSVIPPLCLRFVNGGRSSSLRRMIEFTTKDERRTNEGTTEKEILYQQQTLWRYKATTNSVANVNIGIGINPKSNFDR